MMNILLALLAILLVARPVQSAESERLINAQPVSSFPWHGRRWLLDWITWLHLCALF